MSQTSQLTSDPNSATGVNATGTNRVEDPLQALCQSLTVDNLTNQWVFLPDPNRFIPPYTVGAVVSMNGQRKILARFSNPPGIPATAQIAGQRCNLEAFEVALPPSAGQTITVRAPSNEWRNPLGLIFNSGFNSQVGGAATVADWSYTVPAGRRARVDTAQVVNELSVSDGTGSGTVVEAIVAFFPLGGTGAALVDAAIVNGTVVGARADAALAAGKELQATDIVQGQRKNPRGAGVTANMIEIAIITEGDA